MKDAYFNNRYDKMFSVFLAEIKQHHLVTIDDKGRLLISAHARVLAGPRYRGRGHSLNPVIINGVAAGAYFEHLNSDFMQALRATWPQPTRRQFMVQDQDGFFYHDHLEEAEAFIRAFGT